MLMKMRSKRSERSSCLKFSQSPKINFLITDNLSIKITTNPLLPLDPPKLGGLLEDSGAKLFLRSVAFHQISSAFLELISIKIKQGKGECLLEVPSLRLPA